MRPPQPVVTTRLVDNDALAREVAPRCGKLLLDVIDNRFVRAIGARRLGEVQRYVARSNHGFIMVAMAGDKVIGSGCGAFDSRKLLLEVIFRRFWLFLPAVLEALLQPRMLIHMLSTVNYGKQDFLQDLPDAELIYMNIDKEFRGTGVSDEMLDLACDRFSAAGIRRFKGLTSEHNARAAGWAEAHGGELVDEANLYPERKSRLFVLDVEAREHSRRKAAAE